MRGTPQTAAGTDTTSRDGGAIQVHMNAPITGDGSDGHDGSIGDLVYNASYDDDQHQV